jgi:hypothetical protein
MVDRTSGDVNVRKLKDGESPGRSKPVGMLERTFGEVPIICS